MSRLHRLVRLLHFIGLVMFLGSIFGHVALQAIPGADADSQTIVFTRIAIVVTTRVLTVPGLLLLVITGIWMTLQWHGFWRHRWLTLHQAIGLLILLNTLLVLRPLGPQLLEAARELQGGALTLGAFEKLFRKELIFGPVNLVLTLVTVAVAVFRPLLREGTWQRGVRA